MGIAPETWPAPLRTLIRVSNNYLLNPLMLRLAGTRYWYASVIEHTGRRSGKIYATPIVADRTGEEILIPLPYGTEVDWVRNVLAADRARVIRKGRTLVIQSPEVIDSAEALPLLPPDRRRTFEHIHIDSFMRAQITQ